MYLYKVNINTHKENKNKSIKFKDLYSIHLNKKEVHKKNTPIRNNKLVSFFDFIKNI